MLFWIIIILVMASVGLITYVLLPTSAERYHKIQEKKANEASKKLENLFLEIEKKKIILVFVLSPIALGGAGFFFFKGIIGGLIGLVLGLILPNFFIKLWEKNRKEKFQAQLLDSLLILTGSLKAGLSLLQALEVLVEDMSAPISQEFGWVLKEIKMGMSLEQSLHRLNKRMPSEELSLLINSILVAEETGGDITKVFGRLATTVRDNRKLKDNIRTLTLQGRMQGIIMSILPVVFTWWVVAFNRQHFDIMLNTELGRMLLFVAAFLQILGIFLIYKFSKVSI